MDDDFLEEIEEEGLFGEDEALDYVLIEEMENGNKIQKGSGCITSVLILFPTAICIIFFLI